MGTTDDSIKKNISKNIVKYRELANLSQKELASKLGVTPSRVSNWEQGANCPTIDILFEVCKILNISINDIYGVYPETTEKLSYEEISHIRNYRLLDECGKRHVDEVLNWESDRIKTLSKSELLVSQQAQYIAELEKLTSTETVPPEPCRMVYFYQTYPSVSGKSIWADIKIDTTEIPDNEITKEGDFLITMDDDSMEPLFWKTDILLIKKTDKVELGEIGVFTLDGVCFIKELGKNKLISRNPAFPPIMFDKSLECKGKVLCNLMEHTDEDIKYLTERKEHIRRYQETYHIAAESGLDDDDETREFIKKMLDSFKETSNSND